MIEEIDTINSVIEAWFVKNTTTEIVPVKALMPEFIAAGIFRKDVKNGKPIRDILRGLKEREQLHLIPYVHAEQKGIDTYWYFIPKDAPKPTVLYKQETVSTTKQTAEQARLLSDETYVIDLCDTALKQKADRQKRFPFLLGDVHKDGITRTPLPVDAYYQPLNLVIEYKEAQYGQLNDFNKTNGKTVSGVSRGEQRKIYDQRRAEKLPLNGIKLIELSFDVFNCDSENRIIRNPEQDLKVIEDILKKEDVEVPAL
jgi:hypothetical protein